MKLGLRGVIVLLIVIGMPLASYKFVFLPQNRAIETARKEVDHKQQLLEKLREETARNADLVKANEQLKATVNSIEARLPTGKELDGIVRQLSDLAVDAGLKAPEMKSAKPVPAALYMEQPIEIQVQGNFVGFFSFIAQIEKLPRITRIHDMKITGMAREDIELKAEFTLSIYFQDDRPAATTASVEK
jgi:type IV pilus assembly protein PilO